MWYCLQQLFFSFFFFRVERRGLASVRVTSSCVIFPGCNTARTLCLVCKGQGNSSSARWVSSAWVVRDFLARLFSRIQSSAWLKRSWHFTHPQQRDAVISLSFCIHTGFYSQTWVLILIVNIYLGLSSHAHKALSYHQIGSWVPM